MVVNMIRPDVVKATGFSNRGQYARMSVNIFSKAWSILPERQVNTTLTGEISTGMGSQFRWNRN
jgi:hypothetical protein